MTSKTKRSISILLAAVFLCVTSCGRIEIEVEETETEKVTVVPETEETTEAPDMHDRTAEGLMKHIASTKHSWMCCFQRRLYQSIIITYGLTDVTLI